MTKNKSTDELISDIKDTREIDTYLQENKAALHFPTLAEFLNTHRLAKQLPCPSLPRPSNLTRAYIQQIMTGQKSAPSRNTLLCIALAMKLSCEETALLLKYAQTGPLYPRNPSDSIVIHSLRHGLSLIDTELKLAEHSLPPLSNQK